MKRRPDECPECGGYVELREGRERPGCLDCGRLATTLPNTLDQIIAYEQGDLEEDETIDLFQDLLDSGLVWQLQGHYGRTASALIQQGYLVTNHPRPCVDGCECRRAQS